MALLPVLAAPVVEWCRGQKIDVRRVWPCLADLRLFENAKRDENLEVSRRIASHGISLPSSTMLTPEDQELVIAVVARAMQ